MCLLFPNLSSLFIFLFRSNYYNRKTILFFQKIIGQAERIPESERDRIWEFRQSGLAERGKDQSLPCSALKLTLTMWLCKRITEKANFSCLGVLLMYKSQGMNNQRSPRIKNRNISPCFTVNSVERLSIFKKQSSEQWAHCLSCSSNPTYWMCADDFFNWNINDWFADCHHVCVLIHIKLFFWLRDVTSFFEVLPKKRKKDVLRHSNLWVTQFRKQWENLEWWLVLCSLPQTLAGLVTVSSGLALNCRNWVQVSRCWTQLLRKQWREQYGPC